MKLSAASPHISRSQSMFDSKPPLASTGCPGANRPRTTVAHHRRRLKASAVDHQADDFRIVEDADAEPFGRGIVAVQERLAAPEEEGVRSGEMQGPAQGRLEPNTESPHPVGAARRAAHHHARQCLVGLVLGDANEIGHVFVFGVHVGEQFRGGSVHAAEVPRMSAVAATEHSRCAFDDDNGRAGLAGGQRGRESGVASPEHCHVELLGLVVQLVQRIWMHRSAIVYRYGAAPGARGITRPATLAPPSHVAPVRVRFD